MRKIRLLVLLGFALTENACAQALFPYFDGSHWGYINTKGATVIAPVFRMATKFSEGLAAVRTDGTYGYIDGSGSLKIAQVYDFALPFKRGLAIVYSDGKPLFIDQQGRERLRGVYALIEPTAQEGYWKVATDSARQGVINDAGSIVIDTIFKKVLSFSYGSAVVVGFGANKNDEPEDDNEMLKRKIGVLDSIGQWILSFGKWRQIAALNDGYYEATPLIQEEDGNNAAYYLNHQGKILFKKSKENKWYLPEQNFGKGITVVGFLLQWEDSLLKKRLGPDRYGYAGAIDSNGTLLFSDTGYEHITPFAYNRAFAKTGPDSWILIDPSGHRVGTQTFTGIIEDIDEREDAAPFVNGQAFVKLGEHVAVIDTAGRYVHTPVSPSKSETFRNAYRKGALLITRNYISTANSRYSYQYGFRDLARNIRVTPRFFQLDYNAFNDSLIAATTIDDRSAYINSAGKIVWIGGKKPKTLKTPLQPLNIDFMNRGYFYASSASNKQQLAGYGGWGGSDNKAVRAVDIKTISLKILVGPDTAARANACKARPVYVVNGTRDTAYFNAQDSRLYMNVQAKSLSGEWKDIEYLPNSWCGNSYHKMYLAPGECWAFTMPVYEGSMAVKLRLKLRYIKAFSGTRNDPEEILYSGEINGSINPAQFWRKREYFPSGLMDPYND